MEIMWQVIINACPLRNSLKVCFPNTMPYWALSKGHNLANPFGQILMNQMSHMTISITCAHCSLTAITFRVTLYPKLAISKETYPFNKHNER